MMIKTRSSSGRATPLLPLLLGFVAVAAACHPDAPSGVPAVEAPPAAVSPRVIPLDRRSNDVILAWNTIAHDAMVADNEYAHPLAAARLYAMLHLAQHDAINAVDPVFESYSFGTRDRAADPVAAAAVAAHGVLSAQFPEQRATFDAQLGLWLALTPHGTRGRGVSLGEAAGAAILERRSGDGSDTPIVGDYSPGTGAGRYQFTPPFPFAFAPGWRHVGPFALDRADQFRSAPPPALTSGRYAADLAEVKAVGRSNSESRTPEQGLYAKFWYEFSEIGWNRIARTVAAERELGLQSTARLFALLNMALSDAYVAGWDSKYHYDLWRPFTAIRAADTDGNPLTTPDPEWEPAEPTPPVPDFPSTHSALGNAAVAVLAAVFGDATPFTITSSTAAPAGATRSFASFSHAADENADSRVMAGLHFRFACDAGQELGRQVGAWTVSHHLRRR
jgi:hypothetical protein